MGVVVEPMPEIGVTRISRWIFNCYVIEGDEGPVVVDAGLPETVRDLLDHLGGRRPEAVTATHGHCDHLSGIPRLVDELGTPVHLPEGVRPYLDGERAPAGRPLQGFGLIPTLLDQPFDLTALRGYVRSPRVAGYGLSGKMAWPGPEPTGLLTDGSVVPGASEWTVIDVPGHSTDSVAFHHAGTNTLLSGDSILTARAEPRPGPLRIDDRAMAASVERMAALDVDHLLPGHGRPIHRPGVLDDLRSP